MKKIYIIVKIVLFIFCLLFINYLHSQVIASFNAPDTVCVNTLVTVQNTSVGATNYNWSFCAADFNTTPDAVNIGNPDGDLNEPVFSNYVLDDNGNYYGFTVNHIVGELVRLNFGTSLLNNPTAEDLGNINGVIPAQGESIQILRVNGDWVAIIVGGGNVFPNSSPRVVKVDFGNSLTNTPTGTDWGNIGGLNLPHDMFVSQEGGNFYGFAVNVYDNTLTRINFGPDFNSPPTGVNLGNIGNLDYPAGITFVKYNQNWFAFVTNSNSNSLTRLSFGTSLLNPPTGTNIGNPGGILSGPYDASLFTVCEGIYGFVVNIQTNALTKLDFGFDLTSIPQATDLGNIGDLDFPHSISSLFQVGNDIYAFIPNVSNNTLTRIRFEGCQNIPASDLQNPAPILYTDPGIYNINLLVDLGLPTETSYCKTIVVLPEPQKHPIVDTALCGAVDLSLSSNITPGPFIWNTGSTDTSIQITRSGIYWVQGGPSQCTVRDSFSIVENPLPSILLGKDTSLCSNNSFVLNAGNPGSQYSWQDGSTNQTDTVTKGGIYYVTVTDSSKCVNSDTIKVTQLSSPVLSLSADTSVCSGNSVQLSVNASGNNAYNWSPASSLSNANIADPVATPSDTTKYFVTVIGSNTCKASDSITVDVLPKPQIMPLEDTSVCSGNPIQLIINASGNNTYIWSPTSSLSNASIADPVASPSDTTKYFVTVTGSNACKTSDSITVDVLPKPQIMPLEDTSVCTGNSVQLSVNASGNNAYNWSPASSLSNANIADPVATPSNTTKYVVTVTGSNTCKTADSIIVNVSPKPEITQATDTSVCKGTNVVLQTRSNNATIFSWSPSTGLNDPNIADPVANTATSIAYTFTVGNGVCPPADTVINLTVLPLPVISISNDTTICGTAKAPLFATGGTNYLWTPATGLSNTNIPDPIASPLTATTYYVTVTNENNCLSRDSVIITVDPDPAFAVTPSSQSICVGDSTTFTASGGDVYQWYPDTAILNSSSPTSMVYPTSSTIYTVVILNSACKVMDTLTTNVVVSPLPGITVSRSNDINCIVGETNLHATGGISYTWSPATSLSNPNIPDPVATPSQTTMYYVYATNSNGCTGVDSIEVQVLKGNEADGYLVPSAFTPNGDGKNDCFGVKEWGNVTDFKLSVYNRWGNLLFQTTNVGECWDGTYKGIMQASGTYVYQVTGSTLCGYVYRKGTVVLIR